MKGRNAFDVFCYMYMIDIYVFIYVSSPYLLVFGDDRVCGTCEQRILLVELVKLRLGAWASWENLIEFFYYEHGIVLIMSL